MADEEAIATEPQVEAAPVDSGQATAEPGEVQGGETQPQAAPDFSQLTQQIENINRELGQFRRAQSTLDKLPNMIDDRLTKWQKAQALNQLSPEERQSREQLEQSEKALRDFTRREAAEAFKEASKGYLPVIEAWQKKQQEDAFRVELRELAGGDGITEDQFKEIDAAGAKVFQRISADLDSGNKMKIEAALRFMDKAASSGPEFVLFHAQRELAKMQKESANGLVQNRAQAGKAAAQSPRGKTSNANQPRKPLNLMSQAEQEKLIMEVGSDKYGEMLKADMAAAGVGA